MKRFTVVWTIDAQNNLANLWMAAPNPQSLADASDAIDALLATEPLRVGKPIAEGLLGLDVPPLRVVYSVSEADRLVEVGRVRLIVSPPTGPLSNGQGHTP